MESHIENCTCEYCNEAREVESIEYRPFSCDKCGCIHSIQTNHKGQVYSQKCKNWPCTAGCYDFTSMTYWGGEVIEKIARARDEYGNERKLLFKIGG